MAYKFHLLFLSTRYRILILQAKKKKNRTEKNRRRQEVDNSTIPEFKKVRELQLELQKFFDITRPGIYLRHSAFPSVTFLPIITEVGAPGHEELAIIAAAELIFYYQRSLCSAIALQSVTFSQGLIRAFQHFTAFSTEDR